jgi:glutathione S-transferase
MSTPILLTGYPLGSSLGLVAAFEWLGQPYRLARVEMPAEMTTEEYGRVNGRRETPVLIREDGSVLTETLAIARWIEHRDHARRVSFAPGSRESERMWQLMAFLNSGFTGAFTPYWVAMEAQGMPEDARAFLREQGRQAVVERHGKLEAMLDDSPYLMGDRPTLADAVFVGVARWAEFHGAIDPERYPRIRALRRRLEHTDPAVRVAPAGEGGAPLPAGHAMVRMIPLAEALAEARPGA